MLSEQVQGKTYNLFDKDSDTEIYYHKIKKLADEQINKFGSSSDLLSVIQQLSRNNRKLRNYIRSNSFNTEHSKLVKELFQAFHSYTLATEQHLKGLPFWKFRDRRLATSEVQYHLYICWRLNYSTD